MRFLPLTPILLLGSLCAAQDSIPSSAEKSPSTPAPVRSTFQVRYVSGTNVYIDGGRDAGLSEGMALILKQDPTKSPNDASNSAIEPGIIARLKVVAVASTSAVCEVDKSARDLVPGDVVALPDAEVEQLVEKDTLGNSRQYPMVISFSEGDPLDDEIRDTIPRPPLPEVNQIRGRLGFDASTITERGQGGITTTEYGMVFRADFTRLLGTHWNLNGYWRGELQTGSTPSQPTIQDVLNRTYLMSLSYINPDSRWSAGVGRLYLPWASSLEAVDGAYVGRQLEPHTSLSIFAGSTPDPAAWDYNPQRRIGGVYFNIHGGNYDGFHYSSTAGAGVEMLKWTITRPFGFTENQFSFKRYFSLYHSMQIDKPTPNPSTPALSIGLGQSLLSLRVQLHPRVTLELTDTYFRDVPTYDPTLVGTGLLDAYLYQGINGGARVEFLRHIVGYVSLGQSNDSTDPKNSLNKMFGVTVSNIWKTGLEADVRYSQFDSAFASGTYSTLTVTRDLLENLRLNLQGGRYAYTSPSAASSSSDFINATFDTNLGSHLFVESMFTAQRGGSLNYNQWTNTVGLRFNNRAANRRLADANHP
ncbi:MAG: hypothetical protein WBC92_15515 [Terracidiphilus sp.]